MQGPDLSLDLPTLSRVNIEEPAGPVVIDGRFQLLDKLGGGAPAAARGRGAVLGLLPQPTRIFGQRRYPESAPRRVAAILLYSEAGFTLAEQRALLAPREGTPGWKQLAERKIAELDEQIARAQAAREAISHGLRCPHEDIAQCPRFNAGITARLAGQPLAQSHRQLHGQWHEPLPAGETVTTSPT